MKIYTGYFAGAKKYREAGLFLISTSRVLPKWEQGMCEMKMLAPSSDMLHISKSEYEPKFKRILSTLSAKRVVSIIESVANGKDVVLLCYESAKECREGTSYCHRHMIADWLKRNAGIDVTEFDIPAPPPPPKSNQINLF